MKYKYHFRPGYGSENLLIEIYTGISDENFDSDLLDTIKEINPEQTSSEDLWMNDEMVYEFNSSVGNFNLSKSTWGDVFFMSDDQKCIHVINSLLVKDSRFEKVEVDFDKYLSQVSTNYNSIKTTSFLKKVIQFFKNSSRNKDPFHIKNLSKEDYWKKWEFFELMKDLHLASEMLSQREGGYSAKFLSAEEFKDALDDKIDDIEFGNQVDLSSFWIWFAPTCAWDAFAGIEGIELGNRIFERVDKWKKGTIDNI